VVLISRVIALALSGLFESAIGFEESDRVLFSAVDLGWRSRWNRFGMAIAFSFEWLV
jgi:hypothetical protein